MAQSKSVGFLKLVFGADLKGFNRAMKKAQKSVRKFGKSMQRTGANMTRNITLPVIALGAAAIKTFAEFEESMLKVKAVSGATGKEFQMLTENAKQLGSATMFSASQVAELQFELAKLGFKPQQIKDATGDILALAQATSTELAEAGRITAIALNSFNAEASDAGKFADIMALASSSAAIDMEKFSAALPTVGATARLAGDSFEGLSAKLMVLADSGMEGGSMGTHLNKIYSKLAKAGMTWDEGMQKLIDSNLDIVVAQEMFGDRAFKSALILANQTEKTKLLTKANHQASGSAKEMADIMDSGARGAMRRFLSQAEGVAIELGASLIPLFEKLLTGIQNLMRWWSGLNDTTKNTVTAFALVVAGIGPMLSILGSLTVAFSVLVSPIGLAVAAITGIVVAFAYVRENWEAFKERLGDWSWWNNALISAAQFLVKANPINLLVESYNAIAGFFGKAEIPFDFVTDWLEDMKVQTKEYENEFGSFKEAMINQGQEIIDMFGDMNLASKVGVGATGDAEETGTAHTGGFIFDPNKSFNTYEQYLASLEKPTEKTITGLQQFWTDFSKVVQTSWQQVSTVLAESLAQGSESFKEFAANAGNQIRSVIKGLIALGIAEAVTGALKKTMQTGQFWMIPIFAGAAAGLANSAFSSLIPEFAQGGLVSGATLGLIGEGSGTSISNPEVIAPLDKLKNMIGGDMRVTGRLVGNDIFLSNEKTGVSRNRYI